MTQTTLRRGEETLLDIRDSARRRIVCGLRWDPLDPNQTTASTLTRGGGAQAHDLDLICLMFDKYGRFIDAVTGQEGQRIGDSGNIHHTGDVMEGEDERDDEQISIELFNLSANIFQIIFVAEVQSVHSFGDVRNAAVRIANAIDDRNFAHSFLGTGGGSDKNAYVFGCIYRTSRGWMYRQIGQYFDGEHVTDWADTLKDYLVVVEGAKPGEGPPPMPARGQTVPLRFSRQARHRIVCGLNWDPAPGDDIDLDLACVIYNAEGTVVDGVSARDDETVDASGKIYHSGDDTSGEGNKTDDEAISIEIKDLPDYIQHIVFIAEIQSEHSFDTLANPTMRIADGKTNEDQLLTYLKNPQSKGKTACVFARISRKDAENFTLTVIEDYLHGDDIEDWISTLQRYLG